jgi:ABC-type Zn2+ transport system substrate-binding protein/surface adhesin
MITEKTEVPQHQPQYDSGTHSWISGEHQRTVKEKFLNTLIFRESANNTLYKQNQKTFLESFN